MESRDQQDSGQEKTMRTWEALFLGTIAAALIPIMFLAAGLLFRDAGFIEIGKGINGAGLYAAAVYLVCFYMYCAQRIFRNRHLK